MKCRNGFVSNSSSSSFIINKSDVTSMQITLIKNHIKEGNKYGIDYCNNNEEWTINESDTEIEGFTWMDNFSMREFLICIGVDMKKVRWDELSCYECDDE